MSGYYDPGHCPGCGASIAPGATVCESCGLALDGPLALRLADVLREADALVDELRRPAWGSPQEPAVHPPIDPAQPDPQPPRSDLPTGLRMPALSVPAVLLGLGALCVLVAAVVFVAVSWGDLSVASRTMLLLAVSAAVAAVAVVVTRRGLRGSAESLWLVVGGLIALDAAGARAAGLLGVDQVSPATYATVTGLAGLGGFAAVSGWVSRTPTRALVSGQLVAASGLLIALLAQGSRFADDWAWYAAAVVPVCAIVAGAGWRWGLQVLAGAGAALGGTAWLLLAVAGSVRAVDAPELSVLWGEGGGAQLLVASLYAAAVFVLPLVAERLPPAVLIVAATAAVAGPIGLAWLPSAAMGATQAAVNGSFIALVLITGRLGQAGLGARRRAWADGLAVVAAVAVLGLLVGFVALLTSAAPTVADVIEPVWGSAFDTRLPARRLADLPAAWTLPLLTITATLVVSILARLDPRLPAGLAAAASGAALPLLYRVPLWVAVGLPLVFALLLLAATSRRRLPGAVPTAALMLTGVFALALGSTGLTAVVATVIAAIAGTLGAVLAQAGQREAMASLAVLAAAMGVFGWLSLGSVGLAPRMLVLLVFAALVLVASQHPAVRRRAWLGPGSGSAAVIAVSLAALAAEQSYGLLAIGLTLAGTAVSGVALLAADRRVLAPVGAVLLAAATWVRLADVGVEVVEAYTLPSALALVGVGLLRLRRHPDAVTATALLPGLVLAVLPSLLLALEEPLSPRSLLLGTAALGLVLVGAQLHWGAPLLVGGVALALLAVRELAPVALAVPRWTLFAAAGALLLTLGISWERRRAELRTAARYVAALR